jgi:hypothetical protein
MKIKRQSCEVGKIMLNVDIRQNNTSKETHSFLSYYTVFFTQL